MLWAENSFGREPRISTTVYVGQHFELREHDAPIKYVFNGGTRVARVSGTLTATNTRVQRLRVVAGWNLCSMAVTAPNALAQLSSINGQSVVSAAYRWNSVTGGWDSIATADTVVAGTVVWLKSTLATTLRLKGVYPGPAANLRAPPEGAFFPSYGLEIWDFSGRNSDPSVTLQRFDAVAGEWMSQLPAPLAVITNFPKVIGPGEAFFARALVSIDLELPDAALSLRYYHLDHLGSSSCLTDAQGSLIEETANYPFGYPRHQHQPKSLHEPYQFTQKEQDAESGLHYFQKRLLAAGYGRFTRTDPLTKDFSMNWLSTPQKLNAYSYCGNRPFVCVDPSGCEDLSAIQPSGNVQDCKRFYTSDQMKSAAFKGGSLPYLLSAITACEETGMDPKMQAIRHELQVIQKEHVMNGGTLDPATIENAHILAYERAGCSGRPAFSPSWDFGVVTVPFDPAIPAARPFVKGAIDLFGNCENPNSLNDNKGVDRFLRRDGNLDKPTIRDLRPVASFLLSNSLLGVAFEAVQVLGEAYAYYQLSKDENASK